MRHTTRALGVLLLATTALTGHAFAFSRQDDTQARLRGLEDELANVNAQHGDLKRRRSDHAGIRQETDAQELA
jgi:hypothetical protein